MLDYKMMETLQGLTGEKTIYYKERSLQPTALDLIVYQIFSDYLGRSTDEKSHKSEKYYEFTRCWYYTLLRLKEVELAETPEVDVEPCFIDFYNIVIKRTQNSTEEERMNVLYRFPWHLRVMLHASEEETFIESFIHHVASLAQLDNMDFGTVSYQALSMFDECAIDTIQDDITKEHTQELLNQLQGNLHTSIYAYEHLEDLIQHKTITVTKKDQHAYNMLVYIILHYNKLVKEENLELSMFDFVLQTYNSLCYWAFEAQTIKPSWFVKQGAFQHLPFVRKQRGLL